MLWWRGVLQVLLLLLASKVDTAAGVGAMTSKNLLKFSAILIPGLASTRLHSWSFLDCPFSPLDFNPLDPVWIDIRKIVSVPQCWLKCMLLDPFDQSDHPECKSRPYTGISAISELNPGYITGPLSSVWKEFVSWCVEFGVQPGSIVAAPYDWRLAGPLLEERDLYFYRLKLTFETCRKLRGVPSFVFAHSLGNNVFRYFLEWLKEQVPPRLYTTWIDDHILSYYALGAPLLGAPEALRAIISGVTFGLPISEGTARVMIRTFSSAPWGLPLSEPCQGSESSCSRWPVDILQVDMPTAPEDGNGVDALVDATARTKLTYSAQRIADGTFFRQMKDLDSQFNSTLYHLEKYYANNSLFNPLTLWERPPIKNVYCIYGTNLRTEVGYHILHRGNLPYPDNWIMKDVIYETEGGVLQSRSGTNVEGRPAVSSGDSTVPYYSLSLCKSWLGPSINITRTPQAAHDVSDVQEALNVQHDHQQDISGNFPSSTNQRRHITYYEDASSVAGRKTAVWEFEKIDHRNLLRWPVLLRELLLETIHSLDSQASQSFASKGRRVPIRDEDCYWDYARAQCSFLEYCKYRYVFGDVHLGQSCRLKPTEERQYL